MVSGPAHPLLELEAEVARHVAKHAKRANRANPREDRNYIHLPGFITGKNDFPPLLPPEPDEPPRRKVKKKVELIPRNITQEDYIDALLDDSKHIVVAMGPAGTGKTLLATTFAVKSLIAGKIDKIVITRPAVSVDEQHGFLPGGIIEKLSPWMMPILDVFKEYFHPNDVKRMMLDETIEIAPFAYMRGRTFKNAIVIADEMQNSTVSQTKMVLTRIGENSRIIVTGDIQQHDRGYEVNGLKDFIERLEARHSDSIAVIKFSTGDVERHPVIEEILHLYGEE